MEVKLLIIEIDIWISVSFDLKRPDACFILQFGLNFINLAHELNFVILYRYVQSSMYLFMILEKFSHRKTTQKCQNSNVAVKLHAKIRRQKPLLVKLNVKQHYFLYKTNLIILINKCLCEKCLK